ncbi:C1 protein [Siegesbeckia yellow vein Guangxi virus satellite DNA beta]|uniref:C1 protein n=1 Tax=Siegesbeckia yellow vein Guangxi virus satellite DNA beta TaxID=401518 RepID=Q0KFV1_9VIRU|nr:C1 protein [Siegesbeckia yellow vein Guangxi virus satellite DNA beta]CAJ87656.1 C1 protein [Siegesbeckia yellow vein Guangxi virus satellite DNA beta]
MTITYKNGKGVTFTINVRLSPNLKVHLSMLCTNEPIMSRFTYTLPYEHEDIIAPFDINGTEEAIKDTIEIMTENVSFKDITREELLDSIDTMMIERFQIIELDTKGVTTIRSRCTL